MGTVRISHFKLVDLSHIKPELFHPAQHLPSPVFKIFFPVGWTDKIFYFHLLKFSLPENEISGGYFVSESFADLRYPERKLWVKSVHRVFKIHKNSLRRLRSQIRSGRFLSSAHLRFKHH